MLSSYFVIGAFAGVMSGLFGIGGGVVIIPSLAAIFLHEAGIPSDSIMHLAVGTSLATVIVTSAAAMYAHHKRGSVVWPLVKRMLPGLVIGCFLGATIARFLPSSFLRIFFAVFLILIGVRMVLAKKQPHFAEPKLLSKNVFNLMSVLIGTLSSVLGVGGGVLMVPFLLRNQLEMKQAAGTSIAGALIIGVAATIGIMVTGVSTGVHIPWSTGYLYWPAFFGIIIASVLFAPIGTMLSHKVPKEILKRVFGVFILIMACDMLFFAR